MNFFIFNKFFNVSWAPVYVVVSCLSTREGTVFFGTNAKDTFSPSNVGFTTGAFEVVDQVAVI